MGASSSHHRRNHHHHSTSHPAATPQPPPPPQHPAAAPQPPVEPPPTNRYVFAAATPYPNPSNPNPNPNPAHPYYPNQQYPPQYGHFYQPPLLPAPYDHRGGAHYNYGWGGPGARWGPPMPMPMPVPAPVPPPYVEHQKAVTIRNDVNIKKETLKIEPDEQDPSKFLVSFTFDATVAGR